MKFEGQYWKLVRGRKEGPHSFEIEADNVEGAKSKARELASRLDNTSTWRYGWVAEVELLIEGRWEEVFLSHLREITPQLSLDSLLSKS